MFQGSKISEIRKTSGATITITTGDPVLAKFGYVPRTMGDSCNAIK